MMPNDGSEGMGMRDWESDEKRKEEGQLGMGMGMGMHDGLGMYGHMGGYYGHRHHSSGEIANGISSDGSEKQEKV